MTSFAVGPVTRYPLMCLVLLVLAGAVGPARAGADTYDAYEAALSYRDAVHGSADAQADLGVRYAEGHGLPQSDDRALHWLTRAAEQGHAGAELMLGEFYAVGRGTARNDVTAYKWAFLAAVRSGSGATHDSAMALLDMVTRRMSEQQLAEARRLVDEPQSEPATTGSASPSDGSVPEPDSGHRVSKVHHAGPSGRTHRSTRHDGRMTSVHVPRRFHFARPWGY